MDRFLAVIIIGTHGELTFRDIDHFDAIARYLAYMSAHVVIDLGSGITPVTDRVLAQCDD